MGNKCGGGFAIVNRLKPNHESNKGSWFFKFGRDLAEKAGRAVIPIFFLMKNQEKGFSLPSLTRATARENNKLKKIKMLKKSQTQK